MNGESFRPTTCAMALVHERQSRQLCAIHTVNNLLQLGDTGDVDDASSEQETDGIDTSTCTNEQDTVAAASASGPSLMSDETTDGSDRCWHYKCGPSTILKRTARQTKLATKAEFDALADEMTLLESRLFSSVGDGDDAPNNNDNSESMADKEDEDDDHVPRTVPRERITMRGQPTIRERFASNHSTAYFGNYSFECMELALKNRDVDLDWYRLPEKSSLDYIGGTEAGGDRDNDNISTKEVPNQLNRKNDIGVKRIVCGFVINFPDGDGKWSYARRLLAYVPLVGGLFETGRHWYAVSRLRRIQPYNGESNNHMMGMHGDVAAKMDTTVAFWYIIDSDQDEVVKLTSDAELEEYLASIQARGGQIFRATIQK